MFKGKGKRKVVLKMERDGLVELFDLVNKIVIKISMINQVSQVGKTELQNKARN